MKMPEVYKPLLIISFLNVGQQFNGLNVLRVYIVQIFDYVFKEEAKPDNTYIPKSFDSSECHHFSLFLPLRLIQPKNNWKREHLVFLTA